MKEILSYWLSAVDLLFPKVYFVQKLHVSSDFNQVLVSLRDFMTSWGLIFCSYVFFCSQRSFWITKCSCEFSIIRSLFGGFVIVKYYSWVDCGYLCIYAKLKKKQRSIYDT